MDTMYPGAGRIIQEISKELGEADSKDLQSRPPELPEISGEDEDHQFYWGEEVIEKIFKYLGPGGENPTSPKSKDAGEDSPWWFGFLDPSTKSETGFIHW